MTLPTVLIGVALILALIELGRSRGQSPLSWAVLLLSVALVWGKL